jgi:Arc/MetJ-type ribon-helix-helix transcriptional regulator
LGACFSRVEIIHVKVDEQINEKLDHIVGRGRYKNKSEAVRRMLEDHMNEHPELLIGDELKGILQFADRITDEEFRKRLAQGLKGRKSVAQMLAEQERDRF